MKLTVVSVTHFPTHSPKLFDRHVLDFELQTDQNFELKIYHDGEDHFRKIDETNFASGYYKNIKFIETAKRRQCYGHYSRMQGIEECETELIHITNADNQYPMGFVSEIRKYFLGVENLGMVVHNCAHNYFGYRGIRDLKPQVDHIDWCGISCLSSIAKQAAFDPTYTGADGQFAQDCYRLCVLNNLNVLTLADTFLSIHN